MRGTDLDQQADFGDGTLGWYAEAFDGNRTDPVTGRYRRLGRVFGYTVVVHTTQTSSTRVQFTPDGPSFGLDQAPDHIYKRAWQCWREEFATERTGT